MAYLRRNRRLGNGIKYFLDFLVGRERDIVGTWEVGKNSSVLALVGLSGFAQVAVAEVVVGIVGWIRGFEECQWVGVSGDRTWWGAGPVDSWW